jgi:DNA invertase Pin-like site-specific DNA recombinase
MAKSRDNVNKRADRRPVYDSYARLSEMPETGELEKIATQLADNRATIERRGGVLGVELADGLSAWKRGVRRPDWERLLQRAHAGESDGIAVWHTDRLFRQPKDLEALIDLADSGFTVLSSRGSRDLDNPDDRFVLRIEVAHGARSSDDTQRRAKRRLRRLRERGVPTSTGRPFGFPGLQRLPRQQTRRHLGGGVEGLAAWQEELASRQRPERRPVAEEQVERERAALVSGTTAVLAGLALNAVAREWNTAGLTTAEGKAFDGNAVRRVLLRPRNAGLIEDDGVLVSRMPGDPVIDEQVFERLRALFNGRKVGTGPKAAYLASGIAVCALCGAGLSGRPQSSRCYPDGQVRRQYVCRKTRKGGCGKVSVDARAVEDEIRGLVLARLSDPRHASALTAARSQAAERLGEVEREISECEQLQDALSERLGARQMSLGAFDKANRPLARDLIRLGEERERLLAAEAGGVGGPVQASSTAEVFQQWEQASTEQRRAMLRTSLGRDQFSIAPGTPGRGFDPNRIKVVPA